MQRNCLALILLFATALRVTGLDWGIRALDGFRLNEEPVSVNNAGFSADAEALHLAAETLDEAYYPQVEYGGQRHLFNSYGNLYLYLYRMAGSVGSVLVDFVPFGKAAHNANSTRLTGRWVSAVAGVALVWVTWLVGSQILGTPGAALSALLAAVLPMSVQAGHLASVDGLLGLWYALGLWASLRVYSSGCLRDYLINGTVLGLAVATKINGLFLLLPLGLAHFLRQSDCPDLASVRAAVLAPRVYVAVGLGLLVWIVLTPAAVFLFSDYFSPEFPGPYHINFSLRKASETVAAHRGWLHLEGASTYLHHPLHVFPLGLGWTVQIALIAGLGLVVLRRSPAIAIVGISFVVYYLLIARLPDKPIRFFVPLATYIAVLAAYPITSLFKRGHVGVFCVVAVLLLEPAARSVDLVEVYGREDSRVAAAQWIQDNIPLGGKLMLERGHNSLAPLVSNTRFAVLVADLDHELGNSRGDSLAQAGHYTAIVESEFLAHVDYYVMSEERLALQKVRSSAKDFYARLFRGELGFVLRDSFSMRPNFLGISWEDRNTDLNWTRYDHPTTYVFERVDQTPKLYNLEPELSVYRLQKPSDASYLLLKAQALKDYALFKRVLPASYKKRKHERDIAERFLAFMKDPSTLSGSAGKVTLLPEGKVWRVRVAE